jgi:hypothetical protein
MLKQVINQCQSPFKYNSYTHPNEYSTALYGIETGYLVRLDRGEFLSTEKGINYLNSSIRAQKGNNPKLRIILTQASSDRGYIAKEDFSSSVRYAKKCGYIVPKEGHKAKYYVITDKGREKLALLNNQ